MFTAIGQKSGAHMGRWELPVRLWGYMDIWGVAHVSATTSSYKINIPQHGGG